MTNRSRLAVPLLTTALIGFASAAMAQVASGTSNVYDFTVNDPTNTTTVSHSQTGKGNVISGTSYGPGNKFNITQTGSRNGTFINNYPYGINSSVKNSNMNVTANTLGNGSDNYIDIGIRSKQSLSNDIVNVNINKGTSGAPVNNRALVKIANNASGTIVNETINGSNNNVEAQIIDYSSQARAVPSSISTVQNGDANDAKASIIGVGEGDKIRVSQVGTGNTVLAYAGTGGSSIDAIQSGKSQIMNVNVGDHLINPLAVTVGGKNNSITGYQASGVSNSMDISSGNISSSALIGYQSGSKNQMLIGSTQGQTGSNDMITAYQIGNNNFQQLDVEGSNAAISTLQFGSRNSINASAYSKGLSASDASLISATQIGDNNVLQAAVNGSSNTITAQQTGSNNTMNVSFTGNNDKGIFTQSGRGLTYTMSTILSNQTFTVHQTSGR